MAWSNNDSMAAKEYIMAFDYGDKRVGVAVAHQVARLPQPLVTLANSEKLFTDIAKLASDEQVSRFVVGLPRNMDGSLGPQAERCKSFGEKLASTFDLPVEYAEEALSSVSADAYLSSLRGKSVGLDAVAAAVILERYLTEGGVQ